MVESFEFLQFESFLEDDLPEFVVGHSIRIISGGTVDLISIPGSTAAEFIIKLHKVLFVLFVFQLS